MRGGKLWNHGERVLVSLSGQAGQIWVQLFIAWWRGYLKFQGVSVERRGSCRPGTLGNSSNAAKCCAAQRARAATGSSGTCAVGGSPAARLTGAAGCPGLQGVWGFQLPAPRSTTPGGWASTPALQMPTRMQADVKPRQSCTLELGVGTL